MTHTLIPYCAIGLGLSLYWLSRRFFGLYKAQRKAGALRKKLLMSLGLVTLCITLLWPIVIVWDYIAYHKKYGR